MPLDEVVQKQILEEMERERQKKIIIQLYESAMKSEDHSLQKGAIESLDRLAAIDPTSFIECFTVGMEDGYLREFTLPHLPELYHHNFNNFLHRLKDHVNFHPQEKVSVFKRSIMKIAETDLEAFVEMYQESLTSPELRGSAASSIAFIADKEPELFVRFYEEGMMHEIAEVREKTASTLGALARIDPVSFALLYLEGINSNDPTVREKVSRSIRSVNSIEDDILPDVFGGGMNHDDPVVRREVASQLPLLRDTDQELCARLYTQGLRDDRIGVQMNVAETLDTLIQIDKDQYVALFRDVITNDDPLVQKSAMRTLGTLASVDLGLYLQLYSDVISGEQNGIKRDAARTLTQLASIDQGLFLDLLRDGMLFEHAEVGAGMHDVLKDLAETYPTTFRELEEELSEFWPTSQPPVHLLARADPERVVSLYIRGEVSLDQISFASEEIFGSIVERDPDAYLQTCRELTRSDQQDKLMVLRIAKYLAPHRADGALEVYNLLSSDPDNVVRGNAGLLLRDIAESYIDGKLGPIDPTSHRFFEEYLNSGLLELDDSDAIISECKRIIELGPHFERMTQILNRDEVQSVDELLECATITSPAYDIVCKLGEGLAGRTFKAKPRNLDGYHALKVVDKDVVNQDEARSMQNVDHPNVAKVFLPYEGLVSVNGEKKFAIPMEFVEGETLAERLRRPVTKQQAISYTHQLLQGIHAIAARGIEHRDLNPYNVMVTDDGVIKIIDFGIASTNGEPDLTRNTRYGGPDDIFSWGLLAYEISAGGHLLTDDRKSHVGTAAFRGFIQNAKEEMLQEDGKLKPEYGAKIKRNIPWRLRGPIRNALENRGKSDIEHILKSYINRSTSSRLLTSAGIILTVGAIMLGVRAMYLPTPEQNDGSTRDQVTKVVDEQENISHEDISYEQKIMQPLINLLGESLPQGIAVDPNDSRPFSVAELKASGGRRTLLIDHVESTNEGYNFTFISKDDLGVRSARINLPNEVDHEFGLRAMAGEQYITIDGELSTGLNYRILVDIGKYWKSSRGGTGFAPSSEENVHKHVVPITIPVELNGLTVDREISVEDRVVSTAHGFVVEDLMTSRRVHGLDTMLVRHKVPANKIRVYQGDVRSFNFRVDHVVQDNRYKWNYFLTRQLSRQDLGFHYVVPKRPWLGFEPKHNEKWSLNGDDLTVSLKRVVWFRQAGRSQKVSVDISKDGITKKISWDVDVVSPVQGEWKDIYLVRDNSVDTGVDPFGPYLASVGLNLIGTYSRKGDPESYYITLRLGMTQTSEQDVDIDVHMLRNGELYYEDTIRESGNAYHPGLVSIGILKNDLSPGDVLMVIADPFHKIEDINRDNNQLEFTYQPTPSQ